MDSMKLIQEECGKKLVQKTSLAITEGGRASELSYVQGGIVHDAVGVSATKTVATEEKPFVEIDELKGLPNNVAVVLPSNGDRTLAASIGYLRPLWVFKRHPDLPTETSWLDWPADLRATYDLDTIPQELSWRGWGMSEPLDEDSLVPAERSLGRLVQALPTDPPPPITSPAIANPCSDAASTAPIVVRAEVPGPVAAGEDSHVEGTITREPGRNIATSELQEPRPGDPFEDPMAEDA
jgi:hypothetical protein